MVLAPGATPRIEVDRHPGAVRLVLPSESVLADDAHRRIEAAPEQIHGAVDVRRGRERTGGLQQQDGIGRWRGLEKLDHGALGAGGVARGRRGTTDHQHRRKRLGDVIGDDVVVRAHDDFPDRTRRKRRSEHPVDEWAASDEGKVLPRDSLAPAADGDERGDDAQWLVHLSFSRCTASMGSTSCSFGCSALVTLRRSRVSRRMPSGSSDAA